MYEKNAQPNLDCMGRLKLEQVDVSQALAGGRSFPRGISPGQRGRRKDQR
jgi:hypothetical protein